MADNVLLNSGTGGATAAADDIGGIHHQRVKLSVGADGSASDAIPVSAGLDTSAAGVQAVGLVAQYDDIATAAVTENQFAPLRLSTRRALLVEGVASGTVIPVSDGGGNLSIDDGGNTITVDGTVAVTDVATATKQDTIIGHVDGIEGLLTTIDADTGALAAAVSGTEVQVDVVTMPSVAVTNAGTFAVQESGAALTALQLIDDAVFAEDVAAQAADKGIAVLAVRRDADTSLVGTDNDYANLQVNANGALKVEVFSGETLPVSGTVTAGLAAGTNNIGDVDILSIAAGDNNIGNVDVVTLPNVTLAAGTNTNEVVGDAAHDAAAAGNPVLVAGVAQDTDDTAPPNRVSAESDATRFATDRDGSLFVRPHGPQVWSYHVDGSSALTDTSVHAAPGAGLSLYVTDVMISLGAATALNVFFEEGASKVLGPWYLEAVNGRSIHVRFATPKKITANTALTVTSSAAVAHAIDVTGFTAQG